MTYAQPLLAKYRQVKANEGIATKRLKKHVVDWSKISKLFGFIIFCALPFTDLSDAMMLWRYRNGLIKANKCESLLQAINRQ